MKRPSITEECTYIGYVDMYGGVGIPTTSSRRYTPKIKNIYSFYVHKTTGELHIRKRVEMAYYNTRCNEDISIEMIDIMDFLKESSTAISTHYMRDDGIYWSEGNDYRVPSESRTDYLYRRFPQLKPYLALDLL